MVRFVWAMPHDECRMCGAIGEVNKRYMLCDVCEQKCRRHLWLQESGKLYWDLKRAEEGHAEDAPELTPIYEAHWQNEQETRRRIYDDPIPDLALMAWVAHVLSRAKQFKWLRSAA